jgi:hypothetical protein
VRFDGLANRVRELRLNFLTQILNWIEINPEINPIAISDQTRSDPCLQPTPSTTIAEVSLNVRASDKPWRDRGAALTPWFSE